MDSEISIEGHVTMRILITDFQCRSDSLFFLRSFRSAVNPEFNIELAGRPEAFRTSDGTAVPLKEFLGKAPHLLAVFLSIHGDGY